MFIRSSSTNTTRASVGSVTQCLRPDARETAIIADTMKLLGNSGYGKTITHVHLHRDVKYCKEVAASRMINDRRFRQFDVVVDNAYEIEMNKRTVTYALPIHVGFFILQYVKMRMLQSYYDFIDRYLERPLFQYCEMDTDSAYLILVGESFDDLVTPELREHYFRLRSQWLPSECCVDHESEFVRCRLAVILGSALHHAVLRAKHMTRGRPVCSRWSGVATGSWGCAAGHTIASEPPTSAARKVRANVTTRSIRMHSSRYSPIEGAVAEIIVGSE